MNLTNWKNFTDTVSAFINPATLVWAAAIALLVIMVVNLLIAGRSGWAWIVLVAFGAAGKLMGRFVVATVREVASGHDGTGTWDEEH